ncbi:S8 family serine peptidase [Allomuricauda sp. R78024]|uniref:S8 family serine peptidase n=1 Tax=Allomuricauda sp. R78024 TaxID=3093867 RepID=UPI0037C58D19
MKQNNILNFEKLILLIVVLLSHSLVQAQTAIQRDAIIRDYDHSKLQAMAKEFAATARANKQEALALARIYGWEPIKYNADGTFDELMGVRDDGSPIYYTLYNVAAARSTRTNHLNTGGSLELDLNGQGMKVYVWDGGPTQPTHQEFNHQVDSSRVIINDGVTALNANSWHAQHVTGTILAAGVQPNAKGMAPLAQAFTHDWDNDLTEAITAAGAGTLLSNHSYGWDVSYVASWSFGAYENTARAWDELMYNAPAYLPVFAAGNDGNYSGNFLPLNGNPNFDKLSGWQTAKNHLVVANAQDANVAPDGSLISVSINSGSSQGPTDDFRIKPDITGNGTGVYSTEVNSDADYRSRTGTSMAAPNVTGSLLLLQQHYNNLNGSFMRAATLKGLALHTADEAGMAGPDAIFGWGLLNAKAAAQAITANGVTSIIHELTLTSGQSYSLPVEADGVNDLIASISWTDPPGTATPYNTPNNSTPALVNDLDIRVTQASSTFFPYLLTGVDANDQGDNKVDPYERVDVKEASGSYIVTVTHKGSLSGGFQNYSLIITGNTIDDNEAPTVALAPITLTLDGNNEVTLFATQLDNGSTDNITVAENLMFSFDADGNETDRIFDCGDLGNHQVTLYVTDERENSASASTIVTVEENLDNLVAIAKNITVRLDANGQAIISPDMVDNGSNYGCGNTPELSLDIATFDCDDVGSPVTVTLTANHGTESATTTGLVTVEEYLGNLTANAKDITVQLDADGQASISPGQIDDGSVYGCGNTPELSLDRDAFTCDDVGTPVTVILTANQGTESATTTATVTVEEDPNYLVAIAKDITVQLDAGGRATILPEDVDNGSVYGCGNTPELSLDRDAFTCDDVRTPVTVTLTANHGTENATATALVTVEATGNCRPGSGSPLVNFNRGISPNGDGIGDTLIIEGLEQYKNNVLKIYDLSQRLLFSAHYGRPGDGWDGTHEGGLVPVGTYVCVIDYNESGLGHEAKMIYVNY